MLHQAPRPVRMAQTARKSCVGSDRALQRARQALMAFMGNGFFSLRRSLGTPFIPTRLVGSRHSVGETRPVLAMRFSPVDCVRRCGG